MQPARFQYPRPFERLTPDAAQAVHEVFRDAARALRDAGFIAAMDDRAEHLIDALTDYLTASGNAVLTDLASQLGDKAGS